MIHQGELRGVGAVKELTSLEQGQVEIIFCAPAFRRLRELGGEARISGEMVSWLPRTSRTQPSKYCAARAQADLVDAGAQFAGGILRSKTQAARKRKRSGRMNSRVRHVAFNTFREAVRDRVLYNLVAFAVLLSGRPFW